MSTFYFYRFVTTDPPYSRIRDFPENTTQTESNENRNYHPYLGKRNNNIIYSYEVTTTSMFNFTSRRQISLGLPNGIHLSPENLDTIS